MALIEPKNPSATAPPVVEAAPPAPAAPAGPSAPPETPPASPEGGGELPDELLQVPAMQAVLAGQPPAFSTNLKQFAANPVAPLIAKSKNALMTAGIGFYQSLSGDLGVMFNQFYVHPEDVQAADKAGKLLEIAPPFDQINSQVAQSGADNPVLKVGSMPGGAAMPSIKAPPQATTGGAMMQPSVAPASAGIQKQIMGLRAKSLTPSAPTAGPAPGAGRILNQILQPSV